LKSLSKILWKVRNILSKANVNTNDKDKLEDTYQRKLLDLNDKITDFNYDILEDSFILKANDNSSNL
jgi:hypothetical protein